MALTLTGAEFLVTKPRRLGEGNQAAFKVKLTADEEFEGHTEVNSEWTLFGDTITSLKTLENGENIKVTRSDASARGDRNRYEIKLTRGENTKVVYLTLVVRRIKKPKTGAKWTPEATFTVDNISITAEGGEVSIADEWHEVVRYWFKFDHEFPDNQHKDAGPGTFIFQMEGEANPQEIKINSADFPYYSMAIQRGSLYARLEERGTNPKKFWVFHTSSIPL